MEQTCPRCRTSSFQNPQLKLMVNVCGHRLCTTCVDGLFHHPTAHCPECDKLLRRNEYRAQQFEDASVEREVDIRKRILKDYNKRQEDFSTLREYNNYLEEVEEIIFNLANGVDVERTRERIDAYCAENQRLILKNRAIQLRLVQSAEHQLCAAADFNEEQLKKKREEEEALALKKKKAKQDVIDLLATSSRPEDIIRQHLQNMEELSQPTEVELPPPPPKTLGTGHETFLPVMPMDEGEMYTYCPETFETEGPPLPSLPDIIQAGYAKHWRNLTPVEAAGGFTMDQACSRALLDAFSGLFTC